LILGNPSGLSAKYHYARGLAVAGGLGAIGDHFALHADHLWHNYELWPKPEGWTGDFPFFVGLGLRLRFTKKAQFGIRLPVGASYYFPKKPFEIFAEAAPSVRISPSAGLNLDGAAGVRYYFQVARPR